MSTTFPEKPIKRAEGLPIKNIRVDDAGWAEFEDSCRALGTNRSEALRRYIAWANHVAGAQMPTRPELRQLTEVDDEGHPAA